MPPQVNRFHKSKIKFSIPDRVAHRAATKYVEDEAGCWISTYSVASHGYAQVGWQDNNYRQVVTAHRAAWVHHNKKQIPQGHTIDHICKNKRCVRPDHLRCLTNFENARRTAGRDWPIGTCIHGHPNSELHWDGSRYRCKPCTVESRKRYELKCSERVREAKRRYAAKKRAAA